MLAPSIVFPMLFKSIWLVPLIEYFSGNLLYTILSGLSFLKLAVCKFLMPAKAALCMNAFYIRPHLS